MSGRAARAARASHASRSSAARRSVLQNRPFRFCFVEPNQTSRARKKSRAPKDYPGTRFARTVRGTEAPWAPQRQTRAGALPTGRQTSAGALPTVRHPVLAPELYGLGARNFGAKSRHSRGAFGMGPIRARTAGASHSSEPHAARASHALADPFDRFCTEFVLR